MDLSSLSNSDLEALASGNLQGMSTEGLELIAGVTDQRKAHEAKTGFKPAMSSAFQKALGSADVGIAGILDRKSTRLNSSHIPLSRMPSSA